MAPSLKELEERFPIGTKIQDKYGDKGVISHE